MPSRIPLLYGSASFGDTGKHVSRLHTVPECQEVVDCFVGHGYTLFDTASGYGDGTTEEFLGKLDLKGGRVDTKATPTGPGAHSPANLRATLNASIKALGPHKIRVYYLHAPDRATPFEDTLGELHKMYQEGLFEEIGLSNFNSWEVAEFVMLARKNGWKQPTVYQGVYNVVGRMVEPELIPCCRKYGLRFLAYSPLASGLFAGHILTLSDASTTSSPRWNPALNTRSAQRLREKYAGVIPLLLPLKTALDRHGIALMGAAHRWLQWHSQLGEGDGVILGASSVEQLEANIKVCEEGPLPEDVLALLDEAWTKAKSTMPHYAI